MCLVVSYIHMLGKEIPASIRTVSFLRNYDSSKSIKIDQLI